MSECHWIATGYGINENDLYPSVDLQISFIKKYLPDQYEEMQGYINDCTDRDMSNTSDYLDSCERWIEEYQWEMSERVKNMKAEDMAAIFQKYLDTLGISAPIGRQSVEYYG